MSPALKQEALAWYHLDVPGNLPGKHCHEQTYLPDFEGCFAIRPFSLLISPIPHDNLLLRHTKPRPFIMLSLRSEMMVRLQYVCSCTPILHAFTGAPPPRKRAH